MAKTTEAQKAAQMKAVTEAALEEQAKAPKKRRSNPEEKRKDEELKLKKAEAERKNPVADSGTTVLEQMVRELYERPDSEAEEVSG